MRTIPSLNHPFGTLLVLSLSVCVLASTFSMDSILRDIKSGILGRSLPGSLAFAPAGAVGYPPGPVINEAFPTDAQSETETNQLASAIETITAALDAISSIGQAMPAVDGTTGVDEPQKNLATVTGGVIKAATQTGIGNRDMILSSTGLVAPILFSVVALI